VKWLIVPLETFSPSGIRNRTISGSRKLQPVSFSDLPWVVRQFLSAFPSPFIALDESSRIKTNTPMAEEKKSTRTRLVKLLNRFGERCILTGTLKSKSPVNVTDQFDFLSEGFFPESMWEFAERYCILETVFVGKARRRVLLREDAYQTIRKRLKRAYIRGGESQLRMAKDSVFKEFGIDFVKQEHIIRNKKYSPFINQAELLKRIAPATMVVRREDVFDIQFDRFVTDPIMRPVELSDQGKALVKDLVKVGFTDNFVLGKAPALELLLRVQDVCNGFEPIERDPYYDQSDVFDASDASDASDRPKREIAHRPLAENPKLESLMALFEEIGVDTNQAAVWCSRRLLLDACAKRFAAENIAFARYDGSTNAQEKEESVRRFESGEARVFLANPASAAYGLNCLAQCSYAVFICVDDSVERYAQAKARLLRGQLVAPKFCYHIYARGSVEERQLSRLKAGQELLTDANTQDVFEVA
jgi:SNF2 family DNA or RNA helicase